MRIAPPSFRAVQVATVLALLGVAVSAGAQVRDANTFPSRVVRIAVQSGPGGPPDIRARQIATRLEVIWRHPVIVENRPGASGLIAADFVMRAPADGHTLLLSGQALFVVAPHLRKMPLDPMKEFVPVTQISVTPLILMTSPALPVRSVAELTDYARQHPGKLNAAHPGPGTTNHLALLLFEHATGTMTTQVPYKDGVGQSIIDLAGGRVDLGFDIFLSHGPFLKDGRLRPLAVSGHERLSVLPDVPTFTEAGLPDIESVFIWGGFFVRAETSKDVLDNLHRALAAVLQQPEMQAAIVESGSKPIINTPEEFARVIRAEYLRYGKLISDAGIKLD